MCFLRRSFLNSSRFEVRGGSTWSWVIHVDCDTHIHEDSNPHEKWCEMIESKIRNEKWWFPVLLMEYRQVKKAVASKTGAPNCVLSPGYRSGHFRTGHKAYGAKFSIVPYSSQSREAPVPPSKEDLETPGSKESSFPLIFLMFGTTIQYWPDLPLKIDEKLEVRKV